MILCVNANAAVDKTVVIENFQLNAIHRPSLELVLPGGKSCNVARAAKTLGLPAVVLGWVGGYAGNFIEAALQEEGIQAAFVHTAFESRTCLSVVDPVNGNLTEIYERGRAVTPDEMQKFFTLYHEWLSKVEMVTLCGSIPNGVSPSLFADLAVLAREAGVPAIIDTSGEALRLGIEAGRPYMLKCNRSELAEATGQVLDNLKKTKHAAQKLSDSRQMIVVVTLGSAGAVAAENGRLWLAQAPQIQAVSAVGSGDAFLAGLAQGLLTGESFAGSLRLAVAAGSANALRLGAGRLNIADVDTLLPLVVISQER